MSSRSDAFYKPLDAAWKPEVGEYIYLSPKYVHAYGTIAACLLPDLFIVEYHHGGRAVKRQFSIHDLRPYEPRHFKEGKT